MGPTRKSKPWLAYTNNDDGLRDIEKDMDLYDRLVAGEPKHASALEHPAQCLQFYKESDPRSGNFQAGWHQLRKMIPREACDVLDFE